MFTGLVEDVGVVLESEHAEGAVRLRVGTALATEMHAGDSVSVNGVCLTATRVGDGHMDADVGPETLRVSTLARLAVGMPVNLERPLRADGRLGGHFVQGHVDAVGRVEELRADGDCYWLAVSFPASMSSYVVWKGSIAVDGISLTIAQLHADRFVVQVVPFTFDHTNLKNARVHDVVNLECDMVGKYVVRAAEIAGLALQSGRPAAVSS